VPANDAGGGRSYGRANAPRTASDRKEHEMNRRASGIVAVVLAAVAVSAPASQAAAPLPAAGPWYTPTELNALVAASNARATRTPAVHRYTRAELRALVAYGNASFAQKRAILGR